MTTQQIGTILVIKSAVVFGQGRLLALPIDELKSAFHKRQTAICQKLDLPPLLSVRFDDRVLSISNAIALLTVNVRNKKMKTVNLFVSLWNYVTYCVLIAAKTVLIAIIAVLNRRHTCKHFFTQTLYNCNYFQFRSGIPLRNNSLMNSVFSQFQSRWRC